MVTKKVTWCLMVVALVMAAFLTVQATQAASVVPVVVSGNPTCASLGLGEFQFKLDPPRSGTFPYPNDSRNTVTVTTTDGVYFDWSSTISVDAVIVKGGPRANVYIYNPEATADTGLHSPVNASGRPAALSHISFCYDYEVSVAKDATTSFTRTYNWLISKVVSPATWDLFNGQSGTSTYTVAVERTGHTDSDWAVAGTITVYNPAPWAAHILGVSDTISTGINAPVDCGVSFPHDLPSGQTLTCTYETALPDGTNRLNTATATTSGVVHSGSGTADVIFGNPTTVVNETINVVDSNGMSWQFSNSGSVSYDRTFTCPTDAGTHDNVATIVETGQSASATVTVTCQSTGNNCTLTQGYWGTHSRYGPARYDETWALVGEDSPFFDTGKTWYETIQTNPRGNAYYILANQYVAATLNGLHGADTSSVAAALAHATTLLNQYDGNPLAMSAITGSVREDFVATAAILDQYNNGLIGPGHCD